jgi:phosphoglycolate phosphatase-like HAD superfamily hydrolase
LLPDLELLNPDAVIGRVRHAVFDFDGTLSLVREGWQRIMIPMFVEELAAVSPHAPQAALHAEVEEFVATLTGKQTVYQTIELAERIRARGGTPREPLEYKREYLRRLEIRIADRVAGLAAGTTSPESLLIPGAVRFLDALRQRGVRLYLASGTDEPFVVREAKLLGVADYFDGGVWGARDDYRTFSKKMVIDRIVQTDNLHGPELLGVGDGYVEIENTRAAGGVALGLPTKEDEPGKIDAWKRRRLTAAGADMLIPDFRHAERLASLLTGI